MMNNAAVWLESKFQRSRKYFTVSTIHVLSYLISELLFYFEFDTFIFFKEPQCAFNILLICLFMATVNRLATYANRSQSLPLSRASTYFIPINKCFVFGMLWRFKLTLNWNNSSRWFHNLMITVFIATNCPKKKTAWNQIHDAWN